jgi:crotonobetainyl-CoA:carnitine CoA-transferase CaiB-like acyl-CoA transferase
MRDILEQVLTGLGMAELLDRDYAVDEEPTVIDSRFRVDEAATAVCLAGGLLTCRIHELQTGERQSIRVNSAHAALTTLSFLLQTQQGYPICYPDTHRTWPFYPIMDAYRTGDDRWLYIAGVYPHLRDGLMDILDSPNSAPALARAVGRWKAADLEREINARELCGTIVRSREEWRAHPQGRLLEALPVVNIRKLADSEPVPLRGGAQPLSGLKVLDLTHVLAGPMSTRALAGQGADVLHITGPNCFELFPFTIDTGHGKRNAFLDLKQERDRERLRRLLDRADLFVQGFTPGKIAGFGFGVEDVARMRPGIIYVTLSCYGSEGPCGRWGGFEQLGQAASGLMAAHSSPDAPKLVPSACCDYLTGYLATIGMLTALLRRAAEGGSWHVEVALARTGMWLHDLGHRANADVPGVFPLETYARFMVESKTCFGRIGHLGPVTRYARTPPRFAHPVSPLGSSLPHWADEAE